MSKFKRGIVELIIFIKNILCFFKLCWGLLKKLDIKELMFLIGKFLQSINVGIQNFFKTQAITINYSNNKLSFNSPEQLVKFQKSINGLHSLLKSDEYSYSVLIPVYHPEAKYFKIALQSVLDQSAPIMEILVGFDGHHSEEIYNVIEELKRENSKASSIIKTFIFDRQIFPGGISSTTNELAKQANGKFLLLMDHDDWIRCDLLYRYEQVLRLAKNKETLVLYCNEYKIDEKNIIIPGTSLKKPEKPHFPYFFINYICHCLLIPKALWNDVGGLRREFDGAQDYDLCLRLDLAGAEFQNIPLYLYAWRSHAKSTAKNSGAKNYASEAGVKALQEYSKNKNLNWKVEEGYFPTSYKINTKDHLNNKKIHVVVLYKDRKDMTLDCIKSLKIQKNVNLIVTAVDNNSSDLSIKEELQQMGIEVLRILEPFNFSRLNNLAIKQSNFSNEADYILFLNNDVVLNENAIYEMLFWMSDPQVGIVGARLHFENDTIQHGGIDIGEGPSFHINFSHTDLNQTFQSAGFSKVIRVTEAVTGACMMIKKDIFDQVGGFDEVWYPIAFSDTDLSRKVRRAGYINLYNPFAFGYHFESKTRGYNSIEDFDTSKWLFAYTEQRLEGATFYENTELDILINKN